MGQHTDQHTDDPRAAFTAGLRALADWYDEHPDFDLPYQARDGQAHPFSVGVFRDYDAPGTLADQFATAVRQLGGVRDKTAGDGYVRVTREFGPGVELKVWTARDEVCEAVVVGTETVIEDEIVTPAVTRQVETQRDVIRWECAPVLAGTLGVADARASLHGVA